MADYTSVLNLRKPTLTAGNDDIVNVGLDVNGNMDILDLNINMRVVTSDTRPVSPYTGQLIWETDTTRVMMWTGSGWEDYAQPNNPKGKMVQTNTTATGASLTNASAETLYMSATWTREANRRYVIEFGVHSECVATTAAPGSMLGRLRLAAGGSVANTDTFLGSASFLHANPNGTGAGNMEFYFGHHTLTDSQSGSYTVGLFGIVVSANDTMRFAGTASTKPNWISVRDIGAI